MRFIPTRIHGLLDYAMGALLIAAPWILGFADGGAAQWIMVILGVGAIIYSLITDYEWGAAHIIPMRGHLAMDAISGGLLAISPWLFGFYEYVWLPHVVLGVLELISAVTTHTVPDTRREHGHGVPHTTH